MKLLGISGSLRAGSFNTMLVHNAATAAEAGGPVEFTMADLNLPLYDGDVEEAGMPEAVSLLVQQIRGADAIVIATPEYNKGISGVLKNALDWISRIPPMAFTGKPTAIMSAAAGRGGGEVAQFMLRHCLVSHGPRLVMGPAVAIGAAHEAFADGVLKDEFPRKLLSDVTGQLRAML